MVFFFLNMSFRKEVAELLRVRQLPAPSGSVSIEDDPNLCDHVPAAKVFKYERNVSNVCDNLICCRVNFFI